MQTSSSDPRSSPTRSTRSRREGVHAAWFMLLLASTGCGSGTPPVAPVDARPVPSSGVPASTPEPGCTVEGEGEPLDKLLFPEEEALVLFGNRGDAQPLVRIEDRGRYTLFGHWSELSPPDGDGRARLVLERAGSFRLEGFSSLHATRFRLRRRTAIVPDHVWLEPDFLVRPAGASGAGVRVVASVPLGETKNFTVDVACTDLAYDDRKERVRDPELDGARAHISDVTLHDAPGGPPVFEGGTSLFFVVVLEERDGFARVRGERNGILIDGWLPGALVSRAPQGSGDPGGGRSGRRTVTKGTPAKVARKTALLAERGGVRVGIGELEGGTQVRILRPATDGKLAIELDASEVRAVTGVTLEIAEADLLVAP